MRIILLLSFITSLIFAGVGKVSTIVGDANIVRANENIKIFTGTILEKNDVVNTLQNAKLQVIFDDNTIITVGKNSSLAVNDYIFDEATPDNSQTDFGLIKGTFKVITGKIGKINKEKFKLKVKSSTIGIRGTNFIVRLNQRGFNVTVTDGGVYVTHPDAPEERVFVSKNQMAEVVDGSIVVKDVTPDQIGTEASYMEPTDENETDIEESDTSITGEEETQNEQPTGDDTPDGDGEENNDEDISNTTDTAKTTTEDTSENKETTTNENNNNGGSNITGHILGTNYDSTNILNSFKRSDEGTNDNSFKITKSGETINIDDKVLRTMMGSSTQTDSISGSNTYTGTYGDPSTDSYTGSVNVGTLPFSFTYTDSDGISQTANSNYTVYADNLGEFFIGYATDSYLSELFVVGKDFNNTNSLDDANIYVYNDFAEISVFSTSGNLLPFDSFDLKTSPTAKVYYNSLYDSLTQMDTNFYSKGAQEVTFGSSTDVKSYANKYNYTYDTYYYETSISDIETNSTEGTIALKGSKVQGLLYDLNTTISHSNGSSTNSTNIDTIGGAFLDTNAQIASTNDTTLNYTGYLQSELFGYNQARDTSSSFNLTVTKNSTNKTVEITGNSVIGNIVDQYDANGISFGVEGSLANDTAYFINDDIFGVTAKASSTYFKYASGTYGLVDDTGFLIAVPDGGFDSNDNPITLNDDSSWGYWTAKFNDTFTNSISFIDPTSVWVAGIETPASIIETTMINTPGTYSFKGHVLGNVLSNSGDLETIIYGKYNDQSYTNDVTLNFDIGASASNLSGSMTFSSTNASSTPVDWNLTIGGNDISSSGFSGTLTDMAQSDGSFDGKYYGSDSIKSVGGTFSITNSTNGTAKGVFKAEKQ